MTTRLTVATGAPYDVVIGHGVLSEVRDLVRANARRVAVVHSPTLRARAEAFTVVEPFLVAVTEDDDGTIEPLSLREKIRASGLTFEAIAADAVRYA